MQETPGHTFQQLSAEESVKSDERRQPDDRPPKRGLGCLTVLGVAMSVLLLILLVNGCLREAEAKAADGAQCVDSHEPERAATGSAAWVLTLAEPWPRSCGAATWAWPATANKIS